jgi:spore coat protein U-like protein
MKQARLWLACGLLALAWGAQAASCSVSPPQASIGQYDPITSTNGVRALFQIGVTCSAATGFTVTAGPSQTSGSISNRQLRGEDPTSLLTYQLCLDSNWGGSCNIIFGTPPDGNAVSGNIANAGGSMQVVFWALVYGNQPAKPGWHTDYVTISIEP